MSSKLNFIPHINDYSVIRQLMSEDLRYRLAERKHHTSLGRPLYYRINIQIVMTEECPFHCPFCLERKNPMAGLFNPEAQYAALKKVLLEHPNARLTITGGEPGLYPDHVKKLVQIYKNNSNNVFCSINTSGYSTDLNGLAHINLSMNDYIHPDPKHFRGCTIQTVFPDKEMNLKNILNKMEEFPEFSFSFRFLSDLNNHDYDTSVLNDLQNCDQIKINTFRIGDFFVYATFNYKNQHARITLGDMYQQKHNNYQDGYSNIIIHPNGEIGINWH